MLAEMKTEIWTSKSESFVMCLLRDGTLYLQKLPWIFLPDGGASPFTQRQGFFLYTAFSLLQSRRALDIHLMGILLMLSEVIHFFIIFMFQKVSN